VLYQTYNSQRKGDSKNLGHYHQEQIDHYFNINVLIV
jgi:hypothetical protein